MHLLPFRFVPFLLTGCQAVSPAPEVEDGSYIEIWVFRCASEDALRYGDTGTELWGKGWHYVEKFLRCGRA